MPGLVCLLVCLIANGYDRFLASPVTFLTFPDTLLILHLICQRNFLEEVRSSLTRKGQHRFWAFEVCYLNAPLELTHFLSELCYVLI